VRFCSVFCEFIYRWIRANCCSVSSLYPPWVFISFNILVSVIQTYDVFWELRTQPMNIIFVEFKPQGRFSPYCLLGGGPGSILANCVRFCGGQIATGTGFSPITSDIPCQYPLRYKPEGRYFDSRWCYWNVSLTQYLPAALWPWGWLSL